MATSPGQTDLSDGEADSPLLLADISANDLLSEHRTRLWFRRIALTAALATLGVLLAAMCAIVWTFLYEFRTLAADAQVELVAARAAVATTTAASTPPAAASAAAGVPIAVSAPARLVVSLGGFTTAIAALVSAFVVAATVLAIALVRASFTLTARGDDPARPTPEPADDASVTLPTAEFVKAFGESLHTALKGVGGGVR